MTRVELRGRLSNPQALEAVALAAHAVGEVVADEAMPSSPPSAPRRWRLVDRLGEEIIRQLINDGRAGMTKHALAESYGISLSSVKRMLRRP
jgi:hypothetical protein